MDRHSFTIPPDAAGLNEQERARSGSIYVTPDLVLPLAKILQRKEDSIIAISFSLIQSRLGTLALHLFVAASSNDDREGAQDYFSELWRAVRELADLIRSSAQAGNAGEKPHAHVEVARDRVSSCIIRHCWERCFSMLVTCVESIEPILEERESTTPRHLHWLDRVEVSYWESTDQQSLVSVREAMTRIHTRINGLLQSMSQTELAEDGESVNVQNMAQDESRAPLYVFRELSWLEMNLRGLEEMDAPHKRKGPGLKLFRALGRATAIHSATVCLLNILDKPCAAAIVKGLLRVTWYTSPPPDQLRPPLWTGARLDDPAWAREICSRPDVEKELGNDDELRQGTIRYLQSAVSSQLDDPVHAEILLFLGLISNKRLHLCKVFGISTRPCSPCELVIDDMLDLLRDKMPAVKIPRRQPQWVYPGPQRTGSLYQARSQEAAATVAATAHALRLSDSMVAALEELLVKYIVELAEDGAIRLESDRYARMEREHKDRIPGRASALLSGHGNLAQQSIHVESEGGEEGQ